MGSISRANIVNCPCELIYHDSLHTQKMPQNWNKAHIFLFQNNIKLKDHTSSPFFSKIPVPLGSYTFSSGGSGCSSFFHGLFVRRVGSMKSWNIRNTVESTRTKWMQKAMVGSAMGIYHVLRPHCWWIHLQWANISYELSTLIIISWLINYT